MKKLLLLLFTVYTFNLIGQEVDVTYVLPAQMSGQLELFDGTSVPIWGFKNDFSGTVTLPNYMIEANAGDSVELKVTNLSQMLHTIHLHGLDVDQANDGVPSTSEAIQNFGTKSYYFKAEYPGLYFYHCHVESPIHVQLGMYGGVLIKPTDGSKTAWNNGPAFDKDYNWIISDLDRSWHETSPKNGSIPAFLADDLLINGKSKQLISGDSATSILADVNEKVYLRMGNMSYGINHIKFPSELTATLLMTDGRPLPEPQFIDSISIYPGERYEVMLTTNLALEDYIEIGYSNMQTDDHLLLEQVPISFLDPMNTKVSEENPIHLYPIPNKGIVEIDMTDADRKQLEHITVVSPHGVSHRIELSENGMFRIHEKGIHTVVLNFKTKTLKQRLIVQ